MAFPISVGSGATLASNLINGEHLQLISPVSVYPLPASTNYIGLVSVSGTIGVNGLISLSSGTQIGLNPSSNFIGLATAVIGNTPSVTQSGTWTVQPGNTPNTTAWKVDASSVAVPITDNNGSVTVDWVSGATISVGAMPNVTLSTGANYIGLATVNVSNNIVVAGVISLASGTQVILSPSTNYIGLTTTTIGNTPAVSQSGTWNMGITGLISLASGSNVGLNTGANYIGLVTVANTVTVGTHAVTQSGAWNVGMTALTSLASGTTVGINPGANFIGLATVVAGSAFPVTDNSGSITVDWLSGATVSVAALPNVTIGAAIPAGTNYIGLVSVSGTTSFTGNVTLNPSPNFIGLATTVIGSALPAGTSYIGLASVNIGGTLPALTAGSAYIGLASIQGNVNVQGLISLASGTLVGINAGTNVIGKTITVTDTSNLYDGTTVLTPKYALISQASGVTLDVIASVSGKKIRVLSYDIIASGTVGVTFLDNATSITGKYPLVANGGKVNAYNPNGWFQSSASLPIRMNLDAAIAVGGAITYVEV